MKTENYEKIYKYIYDNDKDSDGKIKPNELLGEFEIVFGDMQDYAFSVIGVNKADNSPYNIIGDEVSGFYNPGRGGTVVRIVKINLERPHWA